MSASTINLAVIPGDGIGPEVIAEALKVLEKAVAAEGVTLEQTHYKLGAAALAGDRRDPAGGSARGPADP